MPGYRMIALIAAAPWTDGVIQRISYTMMKHITVTNAIFPPNPFPLVENKAEIERKPGYQIFWSRAEH